MSSNSGGRNLFLPWSHCDFHSQGLNKNTTEVYSYSAHFYCCFTYSSIFKLFHIFSSFFHFKWKKPISFSKPSQFPGSNEHVNSNETVKYWYSAQLCCCFISLENYNFLQEKILPTRYSYIFKLFLIFTPVSSTSSGRNLFLPGSHHSFWFHFPWNEQQWSIYIQHIFGCCLISFENYSLIFT